MTWSTYFKIIGIVYPIYYGINIAYDLIVYYRRKAKLEQSGVREYDLSHLNNQTYTPQKVSEILNASKKPNHSIQLNKEQESNGHPETELIEPSQSIENFFVNAD